jgi:hypothetical protein
MFVVFVALLVGFSCGYLLREIISQRRRAAMRDRFLAQGVQRVTRQQMYINKLKQFAERGLTEPRHWNDASV